MKKFKRILSLILVVALSLGALVACCKVNAADDLSKKCEEVVGEYVKLVIDGKYKEATKFLHNVDVEKTNDFDRSVQISKKLSEIFGDTTTLGSEVEKLGVKWHKAISYKVESAKKDGDKYIVEYTVTYPDWKNKIEKAFDKEIEKLEAEKKDEGKKIEEKDKLDILLKLFDDKEEIKNLTNTQKFVVELQEVAVDKDGKKEIKIISDKKADE